MNKYVLLIEGNGEYAHINHTNGEWRGTTNPADMMTVSASNHVSALKKFVTMLGIEVRYRNGFSVTDRNLHGFSVDSLADVTKQDGGVGE